MPTEFENFGNLRNEVRQERFNNLSPQARDVLERSQIHILGLNIPDDEKIKYSQLVESLFLDIGTFDISYDDLIKLIDNQVKKSK